MDFYIAIDHNSNHDKPWSFVKIEPFYNKKLTVRDARNWFFVHQHTFPNIYCCIIMKNLKKNLYKSIEQVFPSGTSYEKDDEWPLSDSEFKNNNTFFA